MTSKANKRRRGKTREAAEETNQEFTRTSESLPNAQDFEKHISIPGKKPSKSPWLTFISDSEEDPTIRVRVFPRFAIFFLMALTFFSRHLFLTGFEGLGMLHPDENFQAIEVAHAEVYGYGFILDKKYTAGLVSQTVNKTVDRPPPSRIYSLMYVLLFQAREFFGWSATPFVLARRFHGMVAAVLPFSVYKFTRTLFGHSRDIAFMAATLVAFSKHLMLLGIHPILQSFVSPVIFALMTIVLKTFGVDQDCETDQPHHEAVKVPDLNLASKLGLLMCGVIFGVLLFVNADSLLIVSTTLIVCLIPSHSSRMDTLPSKRTLVGAVNLLCGFSAGIALGAVEDYAVHGHWCWTPLRAVRFLIGSLSGTFSKTDYTMYVSSFLRGSHVHVVVMLAAIIVSVMFAVYHWRLSQMFNGTISTDDEMLFRSTFRITTLALVFLVFYSCQSHHDIRSVHDVIILFLIAGSAGVYLLYSSLYAYVMSIAAPRITTRNMVKLILYAELFLYMFEARMTFPTAKNRLIAEWAHEGQWESAFVNRCLRYVGQQSDVTGVVIDYPIQMTGGFSLLHRNVPVYARSWLEFREWGARNRSTFKRHVNDLEDHAGDSSTHVPDARVFGMDDATDFISLLNPGLFLKRVIEKVHFNYVIVTGGRKFFKKGFREVFNTSDTRVFKRSKSWTESEYLQTVADKIPIGTNITILEYEGRGLIALKCYAEAVVRLRTAVNISSSSDTRLETWKLLMFSLRELNRSTDIDETMNACKAIHGSECEQPFVWDQGELTDHALYSDLSAASENYKFPVHLTS